MADLHSAQWRAKRPEGDIFVYAGDMTCHQTLEEVVDFNSWLGTLDFKHKIVIAGNHDKPLDEDRALGKKIITNATYLQNTGIEIEGITFWGSPVNIIEGDWAFNTEIEEQCTLIPDGTDFLITHDSPFRIGVLLKRVKEIKPKYHIFGHMHEGYGVRTDGTTIFANVAMQDETGLMIVGSEMIRRPFIIDW